ncbi:hypothetical protein D9613_001397 [Agrocybe pediades]|uniref:Peptidase M43 pregnancy-associated plasma-A domain-containing protein n=1 Tax=Agrocybe pediades TaxID=84607 RepID=A0A8H4R6Q5_9AGAR|nr:hypothetical protein D9613_001397 [Agrocybe pediades]
MRLNTAFLALALAITSVSAAVPHLDHAVHGVRSASGSLVDRLCGTIITPEKKAAAEKDFSLKRVLATAVAANNWPVYINVHFHVVAANTSIEGGYVPQSQVDSQIEILNKDYKNTGVQFRLDNTSRTINADWFENVNPYTSEATLMKETLRRGGPETLNVYTVSFDNGYAAGLLGYATFPSDYEDEPKDDGVVIQYGTLPSGNLYPYNLGRTLTHEVGHWVGLYHTFQGGCDPETGGDEVADTPAQAVPTRGCPTFRPDTCPEQPGFDPIHNYMDYSDDVCMRGFTPGQAARFRDQIRTYRGINV